MSAGENGQILSHAQRKVDIARIQHELDGLWESFHQDVSGGQTVTRACMSNLIIYCEDDEQSRDVEQSIPDIVGLHPARIIFLTAHGNTSEPGIEAFVSGYYYAQNGGWQVCGEQVRIVADAHSKRRLPSVTRSQLVGDLPTTLWWASRQPPPFAGKSFFKLADLSDQIIYDSVGWTNPSRGMQAMTRWVAAERNEYIIYNLAWRRLKPWRKLLSQVLDPVAQPGALERVSRVVIEHGPHALAIASLLLGWLASRLGWEPTDGTVLPGKETLWNFSYSGHLIKVIVKRNDNGEPAPHKIHWYWQDKDRENLFTFARLDDERLGILEESSSLPARVISMPVLARSALVSAQMAHRTRDKIFERALELVYAMTSVSNA